jgi:SAM-dependent methyltransferase
MSLTRYAKPFINALHDVYQYLLHMPGILKIVYILIICLVAILVARTQHQEGFANNGQNQQKVKQFRTKRYGDIYDDFYVSIYDQLLFSKVKNDYEIGEIVNEVYPSSESRVLDIGSGTGHHVAALDALGFHDVQGVDLSPSMVKEAKTTYPSLKFKVGNALNANLFPANSFTLITCLYFTIYYIDNKDQFFQNCAQWLMPGGYLAVHLVDPREFDPIMPAGDPFYLVSPQNFAKERITSTVVKFDDFDYKANFELFDDRNGFIEPNAVLHETFSEPATGNIRKNEHDLFMPPRQAMLNSAKKAGFIVHAQIDMLKCQYAYQYVYIFQKPT